MKLGTTSSHCLKAPLPPMANVLNTGKAVKKTIAFGVLDLKLKPVNPVILTTRVKAMDRGKDG